MKFVDRSQEMQRLDLAASRPRSFVVLWGRRRVGKSRLLTQWSARNESTYTVADQSAPAVQRRYLASALTSLFPGFDEVEYPDWRALLQRLDRDADNKGWRGPLIIDELPYLVAAQPEILSVLQNWLDSSTRRVSLAVSGSSARMMHSAVLDSGAPLYGRATEAFAVRPLRAGYLADVFPQLTPRALVCAYAVWGGMPRYWELAEPFGADIEAAIDALVLDPTGPLHAEPDRLLQAETPSAMALRPLLDVIGNGAHRVSEIAGRLARPASSLAGPLASLREMDLVRREIPFGSDPKSGKRSLYQIADPFLRFWFRVVAPNRSLLAEAPREARLMCWQRHRSRLEAHAWEELCRASVPHLHRVVPANAGFGPFAPAQRYWRGNDPELGIVARSVAGSDILLGEAKWGTAPRGLQAGNALRLGTLPVGDASVRVLMFTPETAEGSNANVIDARTVLDALR